ncbi:MAG: hypothetical protein RMK84_18075 [Oscillochloridaceae bacterium]|nr:hypothetical protein [Chloroflexaceae bacterium]MDW8392033.1 hypothetical protein [Oscillochloridaceae bacterium]
MPDERQTPGQPAPLPITDLRAQVFALYKQGAWSEALALLAPIRPAEPAEAATVIFWRACFLTLLGRREEALGALEEGLRQGLWWAEQRLRFDPDLQALQGDPALEAVLDECARRRAAAEVHCQPRRLVAAPATRPAPLALVLHGYDGTAEETLPAWEPLAAQGWLVAAPQSLQLAGMAGGHWSDDARARADVALHLGELVAEGAADPARLLLGGFSNGARAALTLALTGAIPASYMVGVAGALRDETLATLDASALRAAAPRVLWLVGERDQLVAERAGPQAAWLAARGVPVTVEMLPGIGHDLPPDLAARVAAWLAAGG